MKHRGSSEPSDKISRQQSTLLPAPLSDLATGERGVVVELLAGRGLLGRMVALGFTPGAPVTVVQNFGRGPIIVLVRDARIALGRGEARHIHVRREAT